MLFPFPMQVATLTANFWFSTIDHRVLSFFALLTTFMVKLVARISRLAISIWTSVSPIQDLMVAIERLSFKHRSSGPLLLLVNSVYRLYALVSKEQLPQVAWRYSITHNHFLLTIATFWSLAVVAQSSFLWCFGRNFSGTVYEILSYFCIDAS